MRLSSEFLRLPWQFDAARLAAEVHDFAAGNWRPHPQGHPGNSALPLVAVNGDPDDDATCGPMQPTPHLARAPYLRQVMAAFDTVCGRSRLMRLEGDAEATPHVDTNYYWADRLRIHVPIVTRPGVLFSCGERAVHMAAGECWAFDTSRVHNVRNPGGEARIHLVVDTVGSPGFFAALARARDPFAAGAPPAPDFVPYAAGAEPVLRFEGSNHPLVMSPWELRHRFDEVLAQLAADTPDGVREQLRQTLEGAAQAWRAAHAEHGEAQAGWTVFAALLQGLDARVAAWPVARLRNGVAAADAVRQWVVRAALNPALAANAPTRATPRSRRLLPAAPVFIVCPPRSGASRLLDLLALAPATAAVRGERHGIVEGIPALHPANRQFDSNRLFAGDAQPGVVSALGQRLLEHMRDRDGRGPGQWQGPVRLLESSSKNALRVPFLAEAFPDARFVYLYRDARETLSGMLDAWRAGDCVTYPALPGHPDTPWSLPLVSGWRAWIDEPLPARVARQWSALVRTLLDDLEALPPERWCVASYDRLLEHPAEEIARLREFLALPWDARAEAALASTTQAESSPAPRQWAHNADALESVMELAAAQAARAYALFARPPANRALEKRRPAGPAAAAVATTEFSSVHAGAFAPLLEALGGSLALTTYQSGRLVLVRSRDGQLNTHLAAFPMPMGLARRGRELALGTRTGIWMFGDQPAAAASLPPPGSHDACFVPVRSHVTGDIRVHELVFANDGLWLANTRFSCLARLDGEHSFVPAWRPRFISALAAEDRCHLNGIALRDGRVDCVSVLGESDAPGGWRARKRDGGCLIDVASGEIFARGLCMPHSPRWHEGRLYVLESGKGTLAQVDARDGRVETVIELPGFTRGLAIVGRHAFVGLSQVRETVFDGLPVAQALRERRCGVWVVDLVQARIVAFLRFEGEVREIFDVQFLAGLRHPDVLEPEHERTASSFLLPASALAPQ